jgi:hypothetical protein
MASLVLFLPTVLESLAEMTLTGLRSSTATSSFWLSLLTPTWHALKSSMHDGTVSSVAISNPRHSLRSAFTPAAQHRAAVATDATTSARILGSSRKVNSERSRLFNMPYYKSTICHSTGKQFSTNELLIEHDAANAQGRRCARHGHRGQR